MDHTLPSSDDESEHLARINQRIAQLGANAAKRRQKAADKENNNNGNITAKGVRGALRSARIDSNGGKNSSLLLTDICLIRCAAKKSQTFFQLDCLCV
jgi:hypothetical protein